MAYKKQATFGEYTIGVRENNSIEVLVNGKPYDGAVKPLLRDIARQVGLTVEKTWTTRDLGRVLVKYFNGCTNRKQKKLSDFASLVKEEIECFLENREELFFNERDLQMHLALYLIDKHRDEWDVDVEYYVPSKQFDKDYPWKKSRNPKEPQEMRIDIVVSDKEKQEYVPIEIKYKTKKIDSKSIKNFDRLGECEEELDLLKDQSARDLGMYNYWKDIRRVELVCKKYEKVKNGFALFLTNDIKYTDKPSKEDCNYYNFSIHQNKHLNKEEIKWKSDDSKIAKSPSYPAFKVDGEYCLGWDYSKCKLQGEQFYYCLIDIKSLELENKGEC